MKRLLLLRSVCGEQNVGPNQKHRGDAFRTRRCPSVGNIECMIFVWSGGVVKEAAWGNRRRWIDRSRHCGGGLSTSTSALEWLRSTFKPVELTALEAERSFEAAISPVRRK